MVMMAMGVNDAVAAAAVDDARTIQPSKPVFPIPPQLASCRDTGRIVYRR